MRAYVRGQEAMVGPYSIYVDSSKSAYGQGGGGKSVTVQRTTNQRNNNAPMLTFFFKMGQAQALGYSVNPAMGLAIADVFEFVGKKCLELEFSRSPTAIQSGAYENPNISSPPGSNATPVSAPGPFDNVGQGVVENFSGMFQNDIPF
jgi:hypothetical protein